MEATFELDDEGKARLTLIGHGKSSKLGLLLSTPEGKQISFVVSRTVAASIHSFLSVTRMTLTDIKADKETKK